MFGKIELDGVVYNKIGEMKVNNRIYVLTISSSELSFLEATIVDGVTKYTKPNMVFTLAANAGTSLTRLNERIVVNHIAKDLKEMIKGGKITNQQQLKDALTLRQNVLTNNQELRRLLRGNVNDLTEEKFANESKILTAFFDDKLVPKKQKTDDFEIVDVDDPESVDRTIMNTEIYNRIKEQEQLSKQTPVKPLVSVPESKEPVSINNGIIEPVKVEVKSNDITPVNDFNSTIEYAKDEIFEKPKHMENPFPVSDKELAPLADKMLTEHKEQLSNEQVKHLEEIQQQEVVKEVKAEEKVKEDTNGKQLVMTKPSKKAAYVDTVILCLISQLGIFALLIFVLLLIK